MNMKSVEPNAAHLEYNQALRAVLIRFQHRMDAHEMLAITAHLCGALLALQDQRKMTLDQAMQIILQNIELGNQEMIAGLAPTAGNA